MLPELKDLVRKGLFTQVGYRSRLLTLHTSNPAYAPGRNETNPPTPHVLRNIPRPTHPQQKRLPTLRLVRNVARNASPKTSLTVKYQGSAEYIGLCASETAVAYL